MAEEFMPAPFQQFTYNIHNNLADPLQHFDSQEFNAGIPAMLKLRGYHEEEKSKLYTLYANEHTDSLYLLIMPISRYYFIFYIKDDDSLIHWKSRYAQYSEALVLKTFLPAPPKPIEGPTFQMNLRKAFTGF